MGKARNGQKFSDHELLTFKGDLLAMKVEEVRKDLAAFAEKHKHFMVTDLDDIEWTLTAEVKTSSVEK